jgi:uncharacterized protein
MSPLRLVLFLAIAGGLLFGIHFYLWARLVRDTALPAPWSQIATGALVVLGSLVLLGMPISRVAPRSVASPVMWVAFSWLGLAFFLLVLGFAMDLGRWTLALGGRAARDVLGDPERRLVIARALGATVGLALGLSTSGVIQALRAVGVKKVRAPIDGLPEHAHGMTIVQITDVHVGATIGREFVEAIVAKVNALDADVVAITGDLVDGSVAELAEIVAPLARLRAKHGVFFVTGNHEYYSGVEEWSRHLATLGVRVLRNERVRVADAFDLAGVDDPTGEPDLPRALAGRTPDRPLVLLAHQPKAILEAEPHGVALQLSGHTHGGQLFPFNFLVRLQQPYIKGLNRHGRALVYVSSGTGYWGPPMRVGTEAEITQISLEKA